MEGFFLWNTPTEIKLASKFGISLAIIWWTKIVCQLEGKGRGLL